MNDFVITIIFAIVAFIFIVSVYVSGSYHTKTERILILVTVIFLYLLYFFFIYFPQKTEIDKEIAHTKKKYDKYKQEAEAFYVEQVKSAWINAMNDRNKYYFIILISLLYLPVPLYIMYLWRHVITRMVDFTLSIVFLALSAFITTLVWIYKYGLSINYLYIPASMSFLLVVYYFYKLRFG